MQGTEPDSSVTLYVTYSGNPGTRFDRDYYVARHLPLVIESFAQHGLQSVKAFFPADSQAGTIAICECRFTSEAAIQNSFQSEAAAAVMDDIPHFTDVVPVRYRAVPWP